MTSAASSSAKPLFSIFTVSAGFHSAGHTLPSKLRAIADAGFQGVEIFQDDLDTFAASDEFAAIYKTLTPPSSPHALKRSLSNDVERRSGTEGGKEQRSEQDDGKKQGRTVWNAHGPCTPFEAQREIVCASYVAGLCASLGLRILLLQPMRDVEGWRDAAQQKAAIQRVRSRFPVMRALGTDLLLCCSNCQPSSSTTGDVDAAAHVFAQLADEAAQYDVAPAMIDGLVVPAYDAQPARLRIAFEALSWGTHIDRWDQAYAVVQRVDRDNFGICFDSFNMLGRQYADPCSPSGIQEPRQETEAGLRASLQDIATRVAADKIFFLQVGDACKMPSPLPASPNPTEPRPARMIWSRGNRLFPGEVERGAFMPTTDFVKAVIQAGYKGPWSIEVFNSSLLQPGVQVQVEHAQRAFKGLDWLVQQLHHACT